VDYSFHAVPVEVVWIPLEIVGRNQAKAQSFQLPRFEDSDGYGIAEPKQVLNGYAIFTPFQADDSDSRFTRARHYDGVFKVGGKGLGAGSSHKEIA
jgi:hypothetical protein